MITQYQCKNEQRRKAVRDTFDNGRPRLNGIDYLEVLADQKTLVVYLIHPLVDLDEEDKFTEEKVVIEGGIRLRDIRVESASSNANVLTIRVNQTGDYSRYTLRLVNSSTTSSPPDGFDPQLSQVEFSFWVEEVSEFDCQTPAPLTAKEPPPPAINYLAKDYSSFRQLMLDRLAVIMPQWKERNPADIGIMLVELLAYTGDYLSYYQDAVATEAYLGTARKRVSVRRHARLLDYFMHDGSNARAWVVIELNNKFAEQGIKLLGPAIEKNRSGVKFLTKTNIASAALPLEKFDPAVNAGAQIFETLHEITLYYSLNEIKFYTWGEEQCYLPKGATSATLIDTDGTLQKLLVRGQVLILEEVLGPETGEARDADITHRHPVRLTQVAGKSDPLYNEQIVEIQWSATDALPFDLQISNIDAQGERITDISVTRGNVVLVDAGCTIPQPQSKVNTSSEPEVKQLEELSKNPGWNRLRPRLKEAPLTQQGYVYNRQNQWVWFDPEEPAIAAMQWKLQDTFPAIAVWENQPPNPDTEPGLRWEAQTDLLISDRFERHFVVETEDDGRAYLRFGDDTLGKKPKLETKLFATYRIGNGSIGNVGAGTIANILILPENLELEQRSQLKAINESIVKVYNPLPAQGGVDAEPIEQVRLYAPQAFREQRRAVTTKDYADIAQRFPGVQKAIANRRWTGSWHTIFITVDREGGRSLDDDFKQKLLAFLEEFRLAGHDIEIESPRFIPLDIAMTVQVKPGFFRGVVKKALLDTFSNRVLADGKTRFFHSDRFTFGQPVYLSQVISTAVQVAGVRSVDITRFQRLNELPNQELEMGQIPFEPLEIARLDNDPSLPESGKIEFQMEGGL